MHKPRHKVALRRPLFVMSAAFLLPGAALATDRTTDDIPAETEAIPAAAALRVLKSIPLLTEQIGGRDRLKAAGSHIMTPSCLSNAWSGYGQVCAVPGTKNPYEKDVGPDKGWGLDLRIPWNADKEPHYVSIQLPDGNHVTMEVEPGGKRTYQQSPTGLSETTPNAFSGEGKGSHPAKAFWEALDGYVGLLDESGPAPTWRHNLSIATTAQEIESQLRDIAQQAPGLGPPIIYTDTALRGRPDKVAALIAEGSAALHVVAGAMMSGLI